MNDNFEKIYFEHKDDVYRLAVAYTQNIFDAEDITQKVFLKIFKNISKIQTNNIKQYLLKVASNECKDFFKSFWRKNITSLDNNDAYSVDKENIELLNILQVLPKKYRICIHLYYFYGYDVKEIAKIERVNENTIKTRLSRGRKILKHEIERKGINEKNI